MKLKDYQAIIDLCDEIQEKTPYCVFFDYSGHIKSASLHISVSKLDYNTRIYTFDGFSDNLKPCETRLREILQDGLTSLSLFIKADENKIKEEFNKQYSLGVPKKRVISNIAKEFGMTQNRIKEVVS